MNLISESFSIDLSNSVDFYLTVPHSLELWCQSALDLNVFFRLCEKFRFTSSADKHRRTALLMLFHSIQVFCILQREAGKQIPQAQATHTHTVSGLTHPAILLPLFPTEQGRSCGVWWWGVQGGWWWMKEVLCGGGGVLSPTGLFPPGVLRQRPWYS